VADDGDEHSAEKIVTKTSTPGPSARYMEQYAAWHMYEGGPAVVTGATTLTRSTMIKIL
jgi:hypothetical protein